MSVSITLRKLKDLVAVCWFIALWEDPEGFVSLSTLFLFQIIDSFVVTRISWI
ncbi:hypothetical protein RchiOBHm_Chr2g0095111 [Rosa chinensis]|uniref:Uncharacterized protein n=1 Tax=Rosa chinensis TaxID=74649 RepID=A0A2P6RKQ2_ROSCH|nr:hypothetical protein RchiOBHm_Chr2g0095111 [Rosa chinensis]